MIASHPRYQDWLTHVFDHPVEERAWHWDTDAPSFEASQLDYAILLGVTFRHSGEDLKRFTDAQVNQGLWYILSVPCSDFMFSLKSPEVLLETRVASIRSIVALFRDCFASRCTATLSHLDTQPCGDLNPVCYMFWDICPLSWLAEAELEPLAEVIYSVLKETLALDHPACKESAIHGYGELQGCCPGRTARAMDLFLASAPDNEALRCYAANARDGRVQ